MAEFVDAILAQIIGNISTALIVVLFYFNFLLFENYLRLIIWAILVSQALRQAKNNVVSVLQYLSSDPDVDRYGFLTCVFSKSSEIFFRHPHDGTRRTAKELFLNYAVFLFSLIGAVSIWMRMFSWVSFLHTAIGFWIVALSLIKVLDRRIFYYRYFISDEVLVSGLLILGFFITGVMVVLYLGTESYLEGSRAAMDLSNWIQTNFINDERKREIWSQQVENSRAMMSAAIRGVENNYNETMWWPPLKSLVKTYYLDAKTSDGNATTQASSFFSILSLPENMTLIEAVSLAYAKADSVNLTSVELSGWTSKGLEVSSMAVGSLAQVLLLVVTLLFAFVSMGIRAFFFISTLFYLLCTSWDPIERFVEDLLPISVEKRPQVVRSLRKVIEGVFFLPLKMSSIHAIVTLASFTIVNADFLYLATTFTFFISIVPIIPPYLVCVPWVISIWITSSFLKAISLFGVQYFAFTMLDDMLYEKSIVSLNSYVSALSVVFGVYVFGFEGVIFGPLSVCGVSLAYEVSNQGIQAAHPDGRAADGMKSDSQQDSADDDFESTGSSFEDEEEQDAGTPANIFSNAMYRVISGPLVDRVRRRFSIDIATEDSVCINLVVDGLKTQRKVRFVVNKTWSTKELHESIRRMLHVHDVEGIYTPEGIEVLTPVHMIAGELLHVNVRPKYRNPSLYTDATDSQVRVTVPLHSHSPSFRRLTSGNSDTQGSPGKSPSVVLKSKRGSLVGLPSGAISAVQVRKRNRLRRQHTLPARDREPNSQRRSSFGGLPADPESPSRIAPRKVSSATFEDVPISSFSFASAQTNQFSVSTVAAPSLNPSNEEQMNTTPTTPKRSTRKTLSTGEEKAVDAPTDHNTDQQLAPAMNLNIHGHGKAEATTSEAERKAMINGTKLLFSPVALEEVGKRPSSYSFDEEAQAVEVKPKNKVSQGVNERQ